jgi:long-chain acyl-CoA synthetase
MTHKGSVGKAFVGTAHILDEAGNELPPGEPGLIYFGDGQEFEYHDDPEKTKESRSPQGWTTINDIGYLDEEGYLYLTDRASNMIISGGVNIYPQEAENVLIMHPKVVDAAVLGVPNEEFGEEVKGVVQPRDMSTAGPELEQELITYCRSKLSKIKCPVSIDFEAEFPRTATGKLLKRLLKERYWGKERKI